MYVHHPYRRINRVTPIVYRMVWAQSNVPEQRTTISDYNWLSGRRYYLGDNIINNMSASKAHQVEHERVYTSSRYTARTFSIIEACGKRERRQVVHRQRIFSRVFFGVIFLPNTPRVTHSRVSVRRYLMPFRARICLVKTIYLYRQSDACVSKFYNRALTRQVRAALSLCSGSALISNSVRFVERIRRIAWTFCESAAWSGANEFFQNVFRQVKLLHRSSLVRILWVLEEYRNRRNRTLWLQRVWRTWSTF